MKRPLTSNTLKLIAIIAMLIDHIAVGFVPKESVLYFVMRFIGRITAPIMCFFIAEGFYHTHDLKKYMLRLGIFAVLAHFPYRLYFNVDNPLVSSIMLPLLLGLCALWLYDHKKINRPLAYLGCFVCMVLSYPSDWSCLPVFFILLFGMYHDDRRQMLLRFLIVCGVFCITAVIVKPSEAFMLGILLSVPLIYLYSGKLGKKSKILKWGFYVFYPLHLSLLYIIQLALR